MHIVEAVDGGADADWSALAGSGATLVFRRGLPQVLQIVARLIAAGLARSTPAAVVCLAPQEACPTLSTSLGELPARIAGEPLPSTALIVVGVLAAPGSALAKHLGRLPAEPPTAARAAA